MQLEEPLIYIDGKLFTGGQKKNKNGDFIAYRDAAFSLEQIGPPNVFDFLFCKRNKNSIEELKRDYIRTVKSEDLNTEEDVAKRVCDNKIMQLVVSKILPKLTGEKLNKDLDNLLGLHVQEESIDENPGDTRLARRVLNDLRINNIATQRNVKSLEELFEKYSSAEHLFEGQSFCKIDDRFYEIEDVKDYFSRKFSNESRSVRQGISHINSNMSINGLISFARNLNAEEKITDEVVRRINGFTIRYDSKNFKLHYLADKTLALNRIKDLYDKGSSVEAVYQYAAQLSGVKKQRELEEKYRDIVNKREYEENGAGFVNDGSGLYVYAKTGTYEINHGRSTYRFPSAKIAVKLRSSGRGISVESPIVMNAYKHPFLQGGGSMQTICLGNFSIDHFNRLGTDEKIVACISKGMETLKFGYRGTPGEDFTPYNRLSDSKYNSYRHSRR